MGEYSKNDKKCGLGTRCSSFSNTYYLPPAAKGHGREIIKRLPYMRPSVRPSVSSSHFSINLNISFIYEDIFTKFAGNVYVSSKFWPHFEKQNSRHSQLFKNHKVVLNLEIFQLASSYLHKRYMARKDSLIVILT